MNCLIISKLLVAAVLTPVAATQQSPWNGTWVLDVARSTPGAKDLAADAYRFTLDHTGHIKWEIPSLDEVVTGRTDGRPMPIHRSTPTPGLTLSVRAVGSTVLLYRVMRQRKLAGEGRMTLVEDGKAWVDLSWAAGHPEHANELVYVKRSELRREPE